MSVSESHGGSRPSMDTEALSEDEVGGASQDGGLEVELDYSSLNPACLVPPTIPNNLGADDIDKVIAALTNVPDVSVPDGLLGSGEKKDRSSVSEERDRRDYSHDRDRERDYHDKEYYDRGKYRGRGRGRVRGFRGRGGYRGDYRGDFVPRGRGKPYIAKGRNIFPQEEERGRGRGRVRVNNLYKRFMQQHKSNGGPEEEEEEFRKSRSRSRSRSKGRKHRSSSSSSSSSSSDSSSSPKKKKKKKDKKHKKKKKSSTKKKKKDASSSESESESKDESAADWRLDLLKKMKDIKNLPPDQLEVEFKKAMAEKKRKEEEEKCIQEIKNRQKMARKVKKESERAAKRAAKKEKKAKSKANSEEKDDGFYTGMNMESDIRRMEEEEAKMLHQHHLEMQFKSSFAEVPFVAEGAPDEAFVGGPDGDGTAGMMEDEMDPYSKARAEQMLRERKDDGEEVSWPAGALENTIDEPQYDQETREQVEAAQEEMENNINMDDKAKNVVSTSKMFSKIRKRIQGKPLKIHLKTNKLSTEEDEGIGLQPVVDSAEVSGLEPLSADDEMGGNFDEVGDEYDTREPAPPGYQPPGGSMPDLYDDEEERRVARFKERSRRRRERAMEAGELEDGEHSPSPEPERPHHRRRRKRRHERREEMEEGEIGEERESRRSRHDHYDRHHDQDHRPSQGAQHPMVNLPLPPPGLPFIDTSRPPPGPIHHPPPIHNTPPPQRPSFYPQPRPYHPPPTGPNYGQHPPPQQRHPVEMYNENRQTERYNAYSSPQKKSYFDSLPAQPRPSENLEAVDSEDEDENFDMTKVSPIMKYIAGKLVEHKYHLELEGPFKHRSGTQGLSRHLFVAVRIVGLLETAGYDNNKMYMSAMFPQGMADIKNVLMKLMTSGKLDPKIKGSRLVKMCMRCIRCFVAYYTGRAEDIASSEGECTEDEGEIHDDDDSRKSKVRTVNTSLTAVLNRIKDEGNEGTDAPEASDPLNSVLINGDRKRFSVEEDNPWTTMEMDMRSNNLKTFSTLQGHFTKQLVGRGVDPRDARDQAGDSIMCFVVANFSDMMLKDMIARYKKVILPEQSELEVTRRGTERTLYDQIVDKLMKHHAEFPLSILQEVRQEPDWKAAMLKKMRNYTERMLKFYMRGLGKLQEGKDNSGPAPADPSELQFNYLPDGLREERAGPAKRPESNFFNMEQAAAANRSFSSYKRMSVDENMDQVSPESSKGGLSRARYLVGTFYVDTLLFQGSSYVYEIGFHMSDSSSIEVYIVPTKLTKQHSVLEMLGFSFNPDEKKYIYMKPGTSGFSRTYSEEHGLERIVQFLKERRFESRGDSENSGLVLTAQTIEDLATWVKFSSFHGKDWELRDVVAGYGCLDLFVEESKGAFSYVGPKLNRDSEANQTFFTWEYSRKGFSSNEMSASKSDALLRLTERMLDDTINYDNFIKPHCFTVMSRQYQEIERRFEIIKDMYNLEYHLATSLNVRSEKRRLFTEGIFCPRSTAELGDRPGLVAARMIRILSELGYSKHSIKNLVLQSRERGTPFNLPGIAAVMERMRNPEYRENCEAQLGVVINCIEEYFLRR